MSLTAGNYNFTITATKADANETSLAFDVEVVDPPEVLDVTLGSISHTQTVYGVTPSIDGQLSPVNVELGTISHTHTLYGVTATVGTIEDTGLPQIQSCSTYSMGEPITITTLGGDLTTFSEVTLTINGIDLGAGSNITSNAATFNTFSYGLEPKAQYNLILGARI